MEENSYVAPETPEKLFQTPTLEREASDLHQMVEQIFATTDLEVRSVLDSDHIGAIAAGYVFATRYHSPIMKLLCDTLLKLQISKKGWGRKDLVASLQSVLRMRVGEDEDESRLRRIIGKD